MVPSVAVWIGLVYTSPSGKFSRPCAFSHGRPATLTVRSVSGRDDPQLLEAGQTVGHHLLVFVLLAPVRDRIGVVQVARRKHELLPLGERHARLLGGGVRRVEGAAPAALTVGLALAEPAVERLGGSRPLGQVARRHLCLVERFTLAQIDRILSGSSTSR